MEHEKKFDPKKLAKLNDPARLEYMPPDYIWRAMGYGGKGDVIDIGAGTGFFALQFNRISPGVKIYACDLSDVMVDWMKGNLPLEVRDTIVPMMMAESSVPLGDSIAGLVYMINLHHELEEPAKLIREARRLLMPGGLLAIIDWKKAETPSGPPMEIRVEESLIEAQMTEGGFTNIKKHAGFAYHNFLVGQRVD